MSFIWPVEGTLTRDFYYRSGIYIGGQHAAIDIAAPGGSPIKAVADGEVASVGWDMYSGFFVGVNHAGGWQSWYRHLYGQAPVAAGQRVSQGQVIGNVGSTGWSTGPHLHFDLWNEAKVRDDNAIFYKHGDWAVDPLLYLGQEDDMGMTDDEKREFAALKAQVAALDAREAQRWGWTTRAFGRIRIALRLASDGDKHGWTGTLKEP